ncbi:MAG: glycerophosphodiester phosphodiesterase family protein, partial [Humibacillus sp.]
MTDRPGPWASGRFDVEGHRGAKGLVVENTLESFAAAYAAGVTSVELDVRLTADGEVVVWHDAVLQPTKCLPTTADYVGARVADLTLDQLRTVDVGSQTLPGMPRQRPAPGARISTLREVLDHGHDAAPHVWWTVELKVNPLDEGEASTCDILLEGVLETMHDVGLERQCLMHSFNWSVIERSAEVAPEVLRSALVLPDVTWTPQSPWTGSVKVGESHDDICAAAADVGAQVISIADVFVERDFVERAHDHGLSVLAWTVNDAERLV